MQIDNIINFTAQKIISGLPEWNHSSAKNDSEIQKQKDLFLQKMNKIKEKGITNETVVLRAIDYCIAKYVPDEHVSIRIQGENQRAGTEIISKDEALSYKIPPSENNNLATSNNEKFAESQLFTLVAPSDENEKSNILVATKEQNGKRVGIVAIDSFMIEMGNEQTREQVGKIADYVLQQSQNWDNIIFDFRGNGGGDSTIIKEIGERLSAKKLEYADKIEVINKELDEPTGAPDFYPQKPTDKTFTGNIYVLQDGGNASATEGAIWMLRQMDNCTTIGENTHGAFAGGDVKRHQISDNVVLRLGNTYRERTMPNGQKVHEGKGIPADIKCSSSKAYDRCLNHIKNNQDISKGNNKMITFSDIVNFPYDEQDVDNDIRHLLATGEFKPAYEDAVRAFLSSEIQNCAQSINDENFHLNVFNQGSMSEDALKKTPAEITPLLDRLGFEPQKREFWYNYFVNPKYGQQKAPPLSILMHKNKKEAITPFGLVTDPFYTVYTEIHELMHGAQAKYFTSSDSDKTTLEHYELLYKGLSRDEAKAIQKAKNPNSSKDSHYERCFIEMQANSAATCYMMLQAMRTGDENIINMVEKRLLNESAAMSGALMNERLGLAYFEYPATKRIIEEVKAGKCSHLLNEKGLLNWQELYKYTKEKIDNMGYSKEDMIASLETAKMLKDIRTKHPDNKAEFLDAVEKQSANLEHPHSTIFNHFVEAQRFYQQDESKRLHEFYHRLGAKTLRDKMLAKTTEQSIPQIEEYRKIYNETQINKNNMLSNIMQSLKTRR